MKYPAAELGGILAYFDKAEVEATRITIEKKILEEADFCKAKPE